MYDQRERELRDYEWTLASVREEAHRLGREQGRHDGALLGKIQLLQELLGDSPLDDEASRGMSSAELSAMFSALQERMRNRDA